MSSSIDKAKYKDVLDALVRLEAEFRRVFPIYYYAEPWAHDRNNVLRYAQEVIRAAVIEGIEHE